MLYTFLLFTHFAGLMMVATAFLALLGMMPKAATDIAPSSSRYLTILGHIGILLSLVSGPLMIWVRYGGFDGISHWFWVKMLFLLVLIGGIVLAARSARRLREGDAAAAGGVRLGRIIATVSLFAVVLSAVLTFN